jgi:hypothetical protein
MQDREADARSILNVSHGALGLLLAHWSTNCQVWLWQEVSYSRKLIGRTKRLAVWQSYVYGPSWACQGWSACELRLERIRSDTRPPRHGPLAMLHSVARCSDLTLPKLPKLPTRTPAQNATRSERNKLLGHRAQRATAHTSREILGRRHLYQSLRST